jgi:perosamine synthetase
MATYRGLLDGLPQVRFIQVTPGSTYIPFRVAIYAERAMELMRFMENQGIQTRTFFYPLHRQPAFQYLRDDPERGPSMDDRHFPGALYAYENGVCLPSYPGLPQADLLFVCKTIADFYSAR